MAFVIELSDISIDSLIECAGECDFEITPFHVNLIQIALLKLAIEPRVHTYMEIYGDDVSRSSEFRDRMSEALYLLWCYCEWRGVGLLNFLVVSGKSGVPGNGVKKEYKKIFGTDKGYETWARMKAREAQFLLGERLIGVKP